MVAYAESLKLTRALYETGIDSDESVAQAETQLEATQAQDTSLGILRAEYGMRLRFWLANLLLPFLSK